MILKFGLGSTDVLIIRVYGNHELWDGARAYRSHELRGKPELTLWESTV